MGPDADAVAAAAGSVFVRTQGFHLLQKELMHILGHHTVIDLHPELPWTDDGGPADFQEEILLRVSTATDAQELDHHAGHLGIQPHKHNLLIGKTEPEHAAQLFSMPQPPGFDYYLPHIFVERWLRHRWGRQRDRLSIQLRAGRAAAAAFALEDEAAEQQVPALLLRLVFGHQSQVLVLGEKGDEMSVPCVGSLAHGEALVQGDHAPRRDERRGRGAGGGGGCCSGRGADTVPELPGIFVVFQPGWGVGGLEFEHEVALVPMLLLPQVAAFADFLADGEVLLIRLGVWPGARG